MAFLITLLSTTLLSLRRSSAGAVLILSISIYSTSTFKLVKSHFAAKLDVLTRAVLLNCFYRIIR